MVAVAARTRPNPRWKNTRELFSKRSIRMIYPLILAVTTFDNHPTSETIVIVGEVFGKKLIENWSKRIKLIKFMNM